MQTLESHETLRTSLVGRQHSVDMAQHASELDALRDQLDSVWAHYLKLVDTYQQAQASLAKHVSSVRLDSLHHPRARADTTKGITFSQPSQLQEFTQKSIRPRLLRRAHESIKTLRIRSSRCQPSQSKHHRTNR